MITLSVGARRARDAVVHEPVCAKVCGARGQRHDGVTQHRRSDSAAACVCVGPGAARAEVPTRFFSDNAVIDFLARELTSTLGVIVAALALAFGGVAVVTGARRRASR